MIRYLSFFNTGKERYAFGTQYSLLQRKNLLTAEVRLSIWDCHSLNSTNVACGFKASTKIKSFSLQIAWDFPNELFLSIPGLLGRRGRGEVPGLHKAIVEAFLVLDCLHASRTKSKSWTLLGKFLEFQQEI